MVTDSRVAESPRVIGESLSTHRNSLNFLRLIFATVVVLSHAASLGWFTSWEGVFNNTTMAQVALYGFFGVSGYLIAQSAMRTTAWGYLWRRSLRIFPGLITCLVVIAAVFGVIAWMQQSHPRCGFSCYLNAPDGPFTYVLKNALLSNPFWKQQTIAGTPMAIIPNWNTPIWTLFFEFLCYLMLLVFAVLGLLRRRILTLVCTLTLWMAVAVITVTPSLSDQFTVLHYCNLEAFMRFAEIFLTASVLYLYRERIPDRGWLALASLVLFVIGVGLPNGGKIPTYSFTPVDIFLPFMVYPVLWLGIHLPFQSIGSKNDYSYGIYIYGWPVTQMFVLWQFERFGLIAFLAACLFATVPFAVASWWLIERNALSLKRLVPGRSLTDRTS